MAKVAGRFLNGTGQSQGRANGNSGLILAGSGLPGRGVLAVIVTQRQDLDADAGAVRRQLAFQYQADLLSAEVLAASSGEPKVNSTTRWGVAE